MANLIAVRKENKDNEALKKIIDLYQSDEIKEFVEENFDGSAIPAW
ncbi:MetQ/NlpA family ABC transporter substrate-binding protein [Lentibacillus sp. L22]|nr:MetQ/NlpA family ABC transporter substrate-binding protein [Lentibacillus daqui]